MVTYPFGLLYLYIADSCGKTTICQYFAHMYQRELLTVNCHMHTEGSHFLGGLRPVRHTEVGLGDAPVIDISI